MADRLVVMDRGRVRQIGTPEELYETPTDAFVAGFIGRCNLLRGRLSLPGLFRTEAGALLPCAPDSPARPAIMALRPERIRVQPPSADGMAARLVAVTYLGAQTEYQLNLAGAALLAIGPTPAPGDPLRRLAADDRVMVEWEPSAAKLLPTGPADPGASP